VETAGAADHADRPRYAAFLGAIGHRALLPGFGGGPDARTGRCAGGTARRDPRGRRDRVVAERGTPWYRGRRVHSVDAEGHSDRGDLWVRAISGGRAIPR